MNTTDTAHDLKKYKIPRKKHKVKFIVTLSLVKNFFLIFFFFSFVSLFFFSTSSLFFYFFFTIFFLFVVDFVIH